MLLPTLMPRIRFSIKGGTSVVISTASGALVVGGVRDICSSIDGWIDPGDRFECSMEYNQSVSGSLW